jgi:hypothetical protein
MPNQALQEILEQARLAVPEIAVSDAHRLFQVGEKITFLDIRDRNHRGEVLTCGV